MPFDFDLAIQVMEQLTPKERTAVLGSLRILIGPMHQSIPSKSDDGDATALWCKDPRDLSYTLTGSGLHEIVSAAGDRVRVPQYEHRSEVLVTFKCAANNLFGMVIKGDADAPAPIPGSMGEEVAARMKAQEARVITAVEALSSMRKERNIL